MKKIAAISLLALAISGMTAPSFARQNKLEQQKKGPNIPIGDLMDGYYTNHIRAQVDLSDEQFDKVAPHLLRMLQERREITMRRNRLLTLLRQATNKGPLQPKRDASDEELAKLTRDLDQTEADRLASQQKFLKNVDPLLNDRQRARLRVVQDNIEKQILNMINNIQRPAPPPGSPAPPPSRRNFR